jgi:hypothetical protein
MGANEGVAWRHNTFEIDNDRMFRQFGALWRASRRLLGALHTALKKGFHNHSEQLIPTVAALFDFDIKDFKHLNINNHKSLWNYIVKTCDILQFRFTFVSKTP